MAVARLDAERTAVLVVDVQERLLRVIHEHGPMVAQIARLLDGVNALGLPVLMTEQYPKGLGATVPEVAQRVDKAVCREEKLVFSACVASVREALVDAQVRSVVVVGIEAHVCVLQTCLDLASAGFVTAVAVDAIGSRRPLDRDVAVQRMIQAGVLPVTVESVLLELVGEAGTERFKAVLPVVK